ncbi:arginine deiminase [Prolixibacteraceae bacterium JC049]|nr:arginine deiminase [Prolixibacteraceae bacterium JC049]
MKSNFGVNVRSEIGRLEGVILHTPGPEVENMTPQNAERALYSDILNLSVAGNEYRQLSGVLQKFCNTFQVKELLSDILEDEVVKYALIKEICQLDDVETEFDRLLDLKAPELARQLLEGSVIIRDNLTRYLSKDRFSLRPLHNFFFTRDASMSMYDEVLIGRMANRVRERESLIMEAIFKHHPHFGVNTLNPLKPAEGKADMKSTIEGGDVLIARDDVLLIGTGSRTSSQGIDFIIETLKAQKDKVHHIVVQELPHTPESFIHLDMVFTFLDTNACMVYEPLILKDNPYQTIHIQIENGRVSKIENETNILSALSKLGFDLKPISCGGTVDPWIQEREQWHSGANFFALAPGKVIGYERNEHTIEALNQNGFEVVSALDIMNDKVDVKTLGRSVITIAGSELARGGGGCRCMTMPVKRQSVEW